LPSPFAVRGRRLVYTQGIIVLFVLCGILLIAFGGITDRLIPLYAVGAFLAFTLSQAGMVAHWKKAGGEKSRLGILVNGLGAVCTGITVLVVVFTKFIEGAWITVLLMPLIMVSMYSIRRHYDKVARQVADPEPLTIRKVEPPIVVIPIISMNKVVRRGVEFALDLSPDVHVLHIIWGTEKEELLDQWKRIVEDPLKKAGLPLPQMNCLESPYRFVIGPIVDYVLNLQKQNSTRLVAVIIPELVEKHWYLYFLHNQRATWLKASLLMKGNRRIVVVNVPWYLDK
jgi:hypothetical protein